MKVGRNLSSRGLFLFDVEGVLCDNIDLPKPEPCATELVRRLITSGKKVALVTNVGRKSRKEVFENLVEIGFPIKIEDIFTAGYVAARYLKRLGGRCFVISEGGLFVDFLDLGIEIAYDGPVEFVAIGASRRVTYAELNHAMRLLLNGAKLICVGLSMKFKGSYIGDEGYFLGEAALAEALRAATGKEPIFIGKPYPTIFQEVLTAKGGVPGQTVMVGDSIESDIVGAKNLGILSILIKEEGSQKGGDDSHPKVKPDLVVRSLKEVLDLLP